MESKISVPALQPTLQSIRYLSSRMAALMDKQEETLSCHEIIPWFSTRSWKTITSNYGGRDGTFLQFLHGLKVLKQQNSTS
jgi:hypothetical protein